MDRHSNVQSNDMQKMRKITQKLLFRIENEKSKFPIDATDDKIKFSFAKYYGHDAIAANPNTI